MKLNFDLRSIADYGGISSYKRNIAFELQKYSDIQITGCYNWQRNIRYKNQNVLERFDFSKKMSIIPDRLAYGRVLLPISYECMMNAISDVNYFGTYKLPNVCFRSPVVSTIHDLLVLKTKLEEPDFVDYHKKVLQNTVSKSDVVITVSESSKRDIVDFFNIDPLRVRIVHNGVDIYCDNSMITDDIRKRIVEKYNLPEHYILYFGQYRKHKNIEKLIIAYSKIDERIKSNLKLVITCKNVYLNKIVQDLNLSDYVYFTGFIESEDKPYLYHLSEIVYYASIYEGFGVPIIEAQACGVPVITSQTSSMPEAAGGGAVLINPNDEDQLLESILMLHNNASLRQELIDKGYENSKKYTWERSAAELHEILTTF